MTEFTITPTKPIGTTDEIMPMDCVADKETRQKYTNSCVARKLPWCIRRKSRKGKVAVVGSGPSVTEYVDVLKEWDGEIWGINRAFEWMRHRGIKPTAFIGGDPEEIMIKCIPNTPDDATYYLASQVHPKVFDYLEGKNIRVWFMADSEVKHPFGALPIYGGSTMLTRAPNLAQHLGYREVHLFGGDSSYTHKTHVHGGDLPPNFIYVKLGDIVYRTDKAMLSQAHEIVEQMVGWAQEREPISVSIYGEGLLQALYAETLKSGVYEQFIRESVIANRKQRRAS